MIKTWKPRVAFCIDPASKCHDKQWKTLTSSWIGIERKTALPFQVSALKRSSVIWLVNNQKASQ